MTKNPKNIVLLSDGTGNAAGKVWRTNVWRLFQALDLTNSRQVAIYDDGVGSSAFKPLAILGGVFGWGLKRNVLDLYKFLCRNYETDARIYAFGFSRGAFTIRVLLGLVANQGLVRFETEAKLEDQAAAAYRAYRKARFHSVWRLETLFRAIRDLALSVLGHRYDKSENLPPPPIRFVGLWDTVAAYGLPIEEMTRGVSQWILPLELPSRRLGTIVQRACHALALDDERTTFHPVLWSERAEKPVPPDARGRRWTKDERISQVWFAGSHSNVGGGYPDDSLGHVSLTWMMQEAQQCELRFKEAPEADPDAVVNARSAADKDGRLYDPRHGLGGYYRYGPRNIHDLCHRRASRREDDEVTIDVPKIHYSAIDRVVNGAHAYAPIGIPARYAVIMRDGEILEGEKNPFEMPGQAKQRASVQEGVWDLVWWRRLVYFATLGASIYLALFPLLHRTVPAREFSTPLRLVSDTVRLAGAVLPEFANWWLDAYASNPGGFLVGAALVALFMAIGVALGARINGRMHAIWRTILRHHSTPAGTAPRGLVYRLRTHSAYRSVHQVMKRHVVPLLFALLLFSLGAALVSHFAFDIADAAGVYCSERPDGQLTRMGEKRSAQAAGFESRSMCWGTGIRLEEGRRYRITITMSADWRDDGIAADPGGFEIGSLTKISTRVIMFAALPLRRVLNRPWFRPIARIGAVGADEYPLDPDTRAVAALPESAAAEAADTLVADIRARRSGELFLYVNDAIIGLPRAADFFYRNNQGSARVEVVRLGRP
jgi:uncharacterized protein (DUF2235 family)